MRGYAARFAALICFVLACSSLIVGAIYLARVVNPVAFSSFLNANCSVQATGGNPYQFCTGGGSQNTPQTCYMCCNYAARVFLSSAYVFNLSLTHRQCQATGDSPCEAYYNSLAAVGKPDNAGLTFPCKYSSDSGVSYQCSTYNMQAVGYAGQLACGNLMTIQEFNQLQSESSEIKNLEPLFIFLIILGPVLFCILIGAMMNRNGVGGGGGMRGGEGGGWGGDGGGGGGGSSG